MSSLPQESLAAPEVIALPVPAAFAAKDRVGHTMRLQLGTDDLGVWIVDDVVRESPAGTVRHFVVLRRDEE